MSRPRGFADLAGRVVGVWGVGVEGSATLRRLGTTPERIVLVDDVGDPDRGVIATNDGGLEALRECDVVLKSPGIPRRRSDVVSLENDGVTMTSALNLWMNEVDRSRVIAVTGTKGKSTTTSLITYFLNALGEQARSAGNIGQPPYDPDLPQEKWTVVEVSSYQAVDLEMAPALVVVTSLGSDHLDWHGSLTQYHEDKLSLTWASGEHRTVIANDPDLTERRTQIGGDLEVASAVPVELTSSLGLLGEHNVRNVAVALRVVALALSRHENDVMDAVRSSRVQFSPLAGRLTVVRRDGELSFVDDGLATTTLATVAALDVFATEPVALIVGGFDRGIDYGPLGEAVARRTSATFLITMADVGERIAAAVAQRSSLNIVAADDMESAVSLAARQLEGRGVVLLSPAAPSFGRYSNWKERSDDFTHAALAWRAT